MISFSILLSVLMACTKSVDTTEAVAVETATVNKTEVLRLVNDARSKGCQCGDTYYPPVSPVAWNDLLEKAAVSHSKDMAANKYFSHDSQNGTTPGDRIKAIGYKWSTYGENIAMGYATEKEVVQGWLRSAGHCRNIMLPNFKEMGVANVQGYWTQDFGTR